MKGGSHVQVGFFATYDPTRRCRAYGRQFRAGHNAFRLCRNDGGANHRGREKGWKAQVNGMIWSPYFVPMQPVIAEFTKETGIGIGGVQDISIFDAPQRAMAEALSKSPQFDFIHIDSNMIPSLASAGYLEPLDEYIKNSGFQFDVVADYGNFMRYGGHTYGIPTDGNVH